MDLNNNNKLDKLIYDLPKEQRQVNSQLFAVEIVVLAALITSF